MALVGDRAEAATYAPLLHAFSKQVFYLGGVGRGHTAKLVVNLVLGLHRIVLSEGLGLAHRCELDLGQALTILKASAAYSEVMDTQGEVMLSRDFARPVARLAQHAKDVGLILELAKATGARVPMSEMHKELLQEATERRLGRPRQFRGDRPLPATIAPDSALVAPGCRDSSASCAEDLLRTRS